jgi:hypothetical protein
MQYFLSALLGYRDWFIVLMFGLRDDVVIMECLFEIVSLCTCAAFRVGVCVCFVVVMVYHTMFT